MANNVRKSSEKARINLGWDAPENRNGKATRRTKKNVNKTLKKVGFVGLIISILFLILGCGIGGVVVYFIARNDCFSINGIEELTLTLGESYVDEGVKIVSFGRDISSDYNVETDLIINDDGTFTANEVGTYYIKYSVDDFKYGKLFTIEKIRLVTFVEETIEEEMDNEVIA